MKASVTILSKLLFFVLVFVCSINIYGSEKYEIKKGINDKNVPYLYSPAINLKCNNNIDYALQVKRYDKISCLELTSSNLGLVENATITFVFEDDVNITIENDRLYKGITCYFGDVWEKDKLWQWLGEKDIKQLIINSEVIIPLRNLAILKNTVAAIQASEL